MLGSDWTQTCPLPEPTPSRHIAPKPQVRISIKKEKRKSGLGWVQIGLPWPYLPGPHPSLVSVQCPVEPNWVAKLKLLTSCMQKTYATKCLLSNRLFMSSKFHVYVVQAA
jgi:hypothetical protein